MKRNNIKILAAILAIILAVSTLAACTSTSPSGDKNAGGVSGVNAGSGAGNAGTGSAGAGGEKASFTQIKADEVLRIMETEEEYVILDVRTEAEFAAGHIPDAICVPNEIIQSIKVEKSDEVSSETSNLETSSGAEESSETSNIETSSNAAASSSETLIPELPDKNQMILVYCRSGNRSKQASQKLVDMGYTQVYEFGGIIDWPGQIVK